MYPKLFTFDTPEFLRGFLPEHLSIYSYGFFIAMGILVSFWYALKQVKKFNLSADELSSLYMWTILASFVGGKLFFYFEEFDKYLADPALMLKLTGGGFVFYGSLIFAVPTMIWWLKRRKLPTREFLDIVAFIGPIVHGIGRIGCFMAGCCHGKVCDNVLGVTFSHPESLARPLHQPLYPTQLFDVGINVIILIVLFLLLNRKQFAGQLFLIYIVLYAIGRSINEIFRGDEARGFVFGGILSHSQFIAIVLTIIAAVVWVRWKRRPDGQL